MGMRFLEYLQPLRATCSFHPNLGYVGPDNFSLKAHDSIAGSNLANVDINVLPDEQTVDVNPPILVPPEDLTVDATAPDGQLVDIGQATVMDDFDPNPDVTNDAPALFQIGTTVVTWIATDVSGNSVEATQRVTVQDDTPPQVEIVSPSDGDSLNEGEAIEIQVDAQDNVKVQRVELFVDENKVGEDTESPFSFPFVAPILGPDDSSPREITLEARAFDLAEQSSSASVRVRVFDVTAPPIPNLVLPPDSSLFFHENPILAWRDVEDPSTPLTYTPRLVNTLNPTELLDLISLNPLAAQPPAVLPDGDYQWQVMATDFLGNASPFSSFFTFSIDTLPPPPTRLVSPADNSIIDNNLPTLEWEDVSGDDTLFYVPRLDRIQDGSTVEIELVSLSLTSAEPITVLDDGNYEWQVTVLDQAGNTADSLVFSFTVDTLVEAGPTIQDLIDFVDSQVSDGKLDPRIARSMLWVLNAAHGADEQGDIPTAVSKIKSFNSRVGLFVDRNLIDANVGQPLIDLANEVISELEKP